jgi:putative acetyltransferase
LKIRTINIKDNFDIATIIRSVLTEFGANKPGTVFYDDTTDDLFHLFKKSGSVYFIAEIDNKVVGGGGIFPTEGLPSDTCELVKMYLLPEARGLGIAKVIIEKCILFAKEMGYKYIYLESMPELKNALSLYEKFGWKYLDKRVGSNHHSACGLWMLYEIS